MTHCRERHEKPSAYRLARAEKAEWKRGLGLWSKGNLARGLGLLEQGELVRGSGHGLHLETSFLSKPGSEEGKTVKTKS